MKELEKGKMFMNKYEDTIKTIKADKQKVDDVVHALTMKVLSYKKKYKNLSSYVCSYVIT